MAVVSHVFVILLIRNCVGDASCAASGTCSSKQHREQQSASVNVTEWDTEDAHDMKVTLLQMRNSHSHDISRSTSQGRASHCDSVGTYSCYSRYNCYAGKGGHGDYGPQIADPHACVSWATSMGKTCFVWFSKTNQCWLRDSCDLYHCELGTYGEESALFNTYISSQDMGPTPSPVALTCGNFHGYGCRDHMNCYDGHGGHDSGFQPRVLSESGCASWAKQMGKPCFVQFAKTSQCWLRDSCTLTQCEHGERGQESWDFKTYLKETCKDEMPHCADWAKHGECSRNAAYMHQNCKVSCRTCNEDRPDEGANPSDPGSWHALNHALVLDEGNSVGEIVASYAGQCEQVCDQRRDCHSFSFCYPNICYLKDKKLTGHEPREHNDQCSSNFKSIDTYFPSDPSLMHASNGKTQRFYAYRATTWNDFNEDEKLRFSLGNNNLGSLGSVMWYLHHEVIFTCTGQGFLSDTGKQGDRKFGINAIQRVIIEMKAPQPLLNKGMNYGVLKSFDHGEDTGPHRNPANDGVGSGMNSVGEWQQYGYNVGCAKGGEFPHQDWSSKGAQLYPDWIWYSFPSKCPVYPRGPKETEKCKDEYPGGMCNSPTGQGNCTWNYEEAGVIDLDELVGIKPRWHSRADFCRQCGFEGNAYKGGACGLSFWGHNIFDSGGNRWRTEQAARAFDKKYPNAKLGTSLSNKPPNCDFNRYNYGI